MKVIITHVNNMLDLMYTAGVRRNVTIGVDPSYGGHTNLWVRGNTLRGDTIGHGMYLRREMYLGNMGRTLAILNGQVQNDARFKDRPVLHLAHIKN